MYKQMLQQIILKIENKRRQTNVCQLLPTLFNLFKQFALYSEPENNISVNKQKKLRYFTYLNTCVNTTIGLNLNNIFSRQQLNYC